MAPLPKRKHSHSRKNKRLFARRKKLPQTQTCKLCGKQKLTHRECFFCIDKQKNKKNTT